MKTKKEVFTLAASLNCTVEVNDDGRGLSVDIDAPTGRVFRADGCHMLCGFIYRGWYAVLWDEMYGRLAEGLEDCTDPACEMCGRVPDVEEGR